MRWGVTSRAARWVKVIIIIIIIIIII